MVLVVVGVVEVLLLVVGGGYRIVVVGVGVFFVTGGCFCSWWCCWGRC